MYKYLDTHRMWRQEILYRMHLAYLHMKEKRTAWIGKDQKITCCELQSIRGMACEKNQMAGYVLIDKKKCSPKIWRIDKGLDENIYYQLFVEIILIGIKEFKEI